MEMKKVLKYAMEIGECMLVSGAGVSRVEDTISRICKAYGAKEANVFSITSSIVTTIEDEKGEILTQTKRIRSCSGKLIHIVIQEVSKVVISRCCCQIIYKCIAGFSGWIYRTGYDCAKKIGRAHV